MKLAYRVCIATLVLLAFVFAASAQTTTTDMKNPRSADDDRNTAPTVGTGGPVGGPTGLFTVYDGQVLRRGEFTFSAAMSNFDRDPGNVDLTEVPVSFQVGITDNFEIFFNTDAYRQVKVNSPGNLSSFRLPNSQLFGVSPAAIVLAPSGPGSGALEGLSIFRPAGSAPFVSFPYIGGSAGSFGLPFSGPVFGFPANSNALIGPPVLGNNGADAFPGIGSVYGSILPGVVFRTVCTSGAATCPSIATSPSVFTNAPVYLPDAPFINRTYGESSFNTYTVGGKVRFTNVNNPVGFGIVGYYKYYADHASDAGGFNMLQRGASPGGNRGDIGGAVFLDARVAKWMNVAGNVGYNWNSSVKAELPGGTFTLLDRPDEFMFSAGVDFPVNRYFQPIVEFRSLNYMGGRTPNAFENNPLEGIAGFRVYPARWISLGAAYRYHANQQDSDWFDEDQSFTNTAVVSCAAVPGAGDFGSQCTPSAIVGAFRGIPQGFSLSDDPHGYIFQATVGRRNPRKAAVENIPANVTALTLSDNEITLPCPAGQRSKSGGCSDTSTVNVTTTATDQENDVLTYNYTVSGGRIVGTGANVQWDLSGLQPGSYTITSGVDDGCGLCGQTKTETVRVVECPDCEAPCDCATLEVIPPTGITQPGDSMSFTANVTGGTATNVTYNWTVSSGEITSGQGTPSITVATTREMANTTVTATVTIDGEGICPTCVREDSDTGGVAPLPEAVQIDEFGKQANDDIRTRLDTFFTELSNNPNNQGYIILYGTDREISQRERLITNHVNFRNFPRERITIVRGGVHETGTVYTKLYRVPPGADNPTP